jgi:uncharacterized protein
MAIALLLGLLWPVAPALAVNAAALPGQPPADHVLDQASLLSRAAASDVSRALEGVAQQGVAATWVSIPRLDYGLSLQQLGDQLLERWQTADRPELLLLIDGQTSATAIVATADLQDRLAPELLRSTARTTMAQPLRDGGRVRQASLDAIERLNTVLAGQEDPGEPVIATNTVPTARVPSRQDTESSNAFTWVIVLLVVGSVVPMLTWWVFSR